VAGMNAEALVANSELRVAERSQRVTSLGSELRVAERSQRVTSLEGLPREAFRQRFSRRFSGRPKQLRDRLRVNRFLQTDICE
jgi:hypothetical protein